MFTEDNLLLQSYTAINQINLKVIIMDFKETKPKYGKETGQQSDETLYHSNEQKPKKDQLPRIRYGDMDITKVIIKK